MTCGRHRDTTPMPPTLRAFGGTFLARRAEDWPAGSFYHPGGQSNTIRPYPPLSAFIL
jgi:hypothetical protein